LLSPGTALVDRNAKFREYEAGGVPEYWILDPEREVAEFYVLDQKGAYQRVEVAPDGEFDSTVVAGFSLKLQWLWEQPDALAILLELDARP
ncbi:MAG: hypothetical protein C0506_15590, partial [Anaerolinea sp.]|nr:hypothetical protein [Anaerolinea sp.]